MVKDQLLIWITIANEVIHSNPDNKIEYFMAKVLYFDYGNHWTTSVVPFEYNPCQLDDQADSNKLAKIYFAIYFALSFRKIW